MGRLGRLYRFFAKQKQLISIHTYFVVRTLKLAFTSNFSQIGEVKWPQYFQKVRKLQTIVLNKQNDYWKVYNLNTHRLFTAKKKI